MQLTQKKNIRYIYVYTYVYIHIPHRLLLGIHTRNWQE